MNVRPTFSAASLEVIAPWRARRFATLSEGQDALVEAWAREATWWSIEVRGACVGYVGARARGVVELFVDEDHEHFAHKILAAFLTEGHADHAFVQSFDSLLLAPCLDLHASIAVRGVLVRGYHPRPLPSIARIRYAMREATSADYERVAAMEQDVFTSPERLRAVIDGGRVSLFERDGELVGFGIVRPVIEGQPYAEIGIAVAPRFRMKGYAVYLLRDLIELAISRGMEPIAGAARPNVASIRMGLRVGMRGRHRLLEVRFPPPPYELP